MAMRLFSREEWISELKTTWKLSPSGTKTATTEIWLTPLGKPISIPDLGDVKYPDSLLNIVEQQLKALGESPFTTNTPDQPGKPA
jgi:hypothetical protein